MFTHNREMGLCETKKILELYVIVELANSILIMRSSILLSFLPDTLMFYKKKYSQVPTNATFLMMKNNIKIEELRVFPRNRCIVLFT